MTREEQAIEYIKTYRELDEKLYNTAPKGTVSSIATKKCLEFWDMAIKALEQEPCEDAISRQAVLSKKIYTETEEGWIGYTVDADYIEHLPSVKPQEPKTEQFAKWVATEIFDEWEYNKDSFAEIACRKLEKLGIVRAKGDEWELSEQEPSGDEWEDGYKRAWAEAEVVFEKEPKTGHWEWLTEDKYRCSNCNHETRVDECMNKPMYDFCPFCGARMVEPQEGSE